MDGKDLIIQKIIADANEKADGIIKNAEKQVDISRQKAVEWTKEYEKVQENLLKKEAEETVSRRLTVAELDVRKLILGAKQKVIEDVLSNVYKSLCELPKKDYLNLVNSLIAKYADQGDTVVLSKDGVLSQTDLDAKLLSGKDLTVSKERGEFIGGVMLVGKTCDKDLTFSAVINDRREEFSAQIAQELFKA